MADKPIPIIRKHWSEEDLRALIREELRSGTFQELLHRAATAAHAEHAASLVPIVDAPVLKKGFWRRLLKGHPPWA